MDPERYVTYYQNQAGNGLPGYAGAGVMYGAGFGGMLRKLFRMTIPLLRQGFSIAKPYLKSAAKNILSDVVTNTLTLSFNNNNAQEGSGLMVMSRKRSSRPPGAKRSGKTQKKRKRSPKKTSVIKRKRKETTKRVKSKRSVKTIF
ncbi:hypothetical protein H4Q32_007310 [Labeo rohita]|uniref:Uncharacterized protein n=1 Tax=Labeo rohita TaxID=84645 RepID=A0ABQ8MFL5_LABRO|nr:hypothetical protein H4Q32_007310 [Labeo rohita]